MISQNKWNRYIERLAEIDERAAQLMREWIDANGLTDSNALIEYAYALATKYGEASAELACEMYDLMSVSQRAKVPAAVPAETATMDEVARGTMWGKYHSPSQIPNIVGRQARQAGADTMIQNAIRDKAQWAWIPSGDTCAFCITLASRGWQDASASILKGKHASHIHANCDCTFAIAHNEKARRDYDHIYDPEKYKEMYYGAEGNTPGDRINAIRRAKYQENREYINAQKRDAYWARKFELARQKKILWQDVIEDKHIVREEKDFDHGLFEHNEDGTFKPSKTIMHRELPNSTAYDIVDIVQKDGSVNRVLYDEYGRPWIRIHPGDHHTPDVHPPGGHLHIIEYGDNNEMPKRNPDWLPLNDVDKIENADILKV